jgi:protein-tyrosine phosphatase
LRETLSHGRHYGDRDEWSNIDRFSVNHLALAPERGRAVIDLHTHILPGLDDGAPSLATAVEMGRAAVEDGITTLAATPHVRDDFPTTADAMEDGVAIVRTALADAGVALELLPGGEIALDRLELLGDEERERFGLGGNPSVLLIETPYSGWPSELLARVVWLRDRGVMPVLAHPERNGEVQASLTGVQAAVAAGALVQVTAASLDGRFGRRTEATARSMLDAELVHLVASDAHAPGVRAIGLSTAASALGDERLARWLTEEVPAALLAGERLPPRPARSRRRLRLFGR